MCEVCHYTPCNPRCPNAPEPPAVFDCDTCGESVCEGEEYYEEPGGGILCQTCVDNMSTSELLVHFGCYERIAEVAV